MKLFIIATIVLFILNESLGEDVSPPNVRRRSRGFTFSPERKKMMREFCEKLLKNDEAQINESGNA